MKPTYEEVVQEFHRKTIYYKTGSYPRRIVNFEDTKYNKSRPQFEKFINLVERNYGHIDWKLMIEALSDFFKGYFNPLFLSNPKGIKIYKNYVREKSMVKGENVLEEIKRSCRNVLNYVKQNNLEDVDAYLTEGQYLIPTIGKHLSGGFISPYFLAIVPDIKSLIGALPPDMRVEYFSEFLEEYDMYRAKAIKNPTARKLADSFYKILNSKLKEKK